MQCMHAGSMPVDGNRNNVTYLTLY